MLNLVINIAISSCNLYTHCHFNMYMLSSKEEEPSISLPGLMCVGDTSLSLPLPALEHCHQSVTCKTN